MDPELLKKWMMALGTHRLYTNTGQRMYICSLHFTNRLIKYNNNKPCLIKNATPSKFNFEEDVSLLLFFQFVFFFLYYTKFKFIFFIQ